MITSNVDHSTKSWERKVDSLVRECATLKEIIRADSKNILQLKADIALLRRADSKIVPEIEAHKSEFLRMKVERDTLLDRELQHVETIKILKEELNSLTMQSGRRKSFISFVFKICSSLLKLLKTKKKLEALKQLPRL
jgi:predicted RNase H-like nuclease (RuvC/YqgF family)